MRHLEDRFWQRDIDKGEWTPASASDNAQFFVMMLIGLVIWATVILEVVR